MKHETLFSLVVATLDGECDSPEIKINICKEAINHFITIIKLDAEKYILDNEKDAALCALNALFRLK